MPDYYAILSRALKRGDLTSARWRESVFEQTRQMLMAQLRAQQPPLSNTEIRLQTAALEAAITTIQSEFAPRGGSAPRGQRAVRPRTEQSARSPTIARARPKAAPFSFRQIAFVAVAVVIAALAAGIYAFVASRPDTRPPPASKVEANNRPTPAQQPQAPPKAPPAVPTAPDGDLAPGVDGGSSDTEVPFYFRRQPVFYRTTNPVGTIIIDKQQHFLYLIQPNQVALRYGIGVGKACAGVAGLHKVTSKVEWPEWQVPAEMVDRKLAPSGVMKGGPVNPLGARLIGLDDGGMRIHGTNAPKTIGNSVNFGCIRLVNDDVVDLYNRVAMGAGVIFTD